MNTPTKFKKSEVKQILDKLDKCYNVNNDPRSDEYKKKRLEQFQTLTDYETKNLVNIDLFFFADFILDSFLLALMLYIFVVNELCLLFLFFNNKKIPREFISMPKTKIKLVVDNQLQISPK